MQNRLKRKLRQIKQILAEISRRFYICQWCSDTYFAGRKNSKTCSDRCSANLCRHLQMLNPDVAARVREAGRVRVIKHRSRRLKKVRK